MKELTVQHYKAGKTWAHKDEHGKQIFSGLSNILDGYCVRRLQMPEKISVKFSTVKFTGAIACLSFYKVGEHGNAIYNFQSFVSNLHPSIWHQLIENEAGDPPVRLYLKFDMEF